MEAMGDFTGGVSEIYELDKIPNDFFMIMLKSFQRQSLMCGDILNLKMVRYSILQKKIVFILDMHFKF